MTVFISAITSSTDIGCDLSSSPDRERERRRFARAGKLQLVAHLTAQRVYRPRNGSDVVHEMRLTYHGIHVGNALGIYRLVDFLQVPYETVLYKFTTEKKDIYKRDLVEYVSNNYDNLSSSYGNNPEAIYRARCRG